MVDKKLADKNLIDENLVDRNSVETRTAERAAGVWRRRMIVLLPLVAFLALAALFMFRLGAGDPSRIPSALIGHVAPQTGFRRLPASSARARRSPASTARNSRAR